MKSKTKKSDKKSTASRGQGSAQQHRLTSGVHTPSPPHETTIPSTAVVVGPDASPLPGGQSLTVRIASKTLGRKSCEPTGNGHPLKEGSEVTGSEPVGTSVVLAGGSDTAPEVVEGPEMKQRMMISVDGSGSSSSSSSSNHQTPPTKRMKMMMTRETQPSSSSLSSAERCNAGVLTDPDCLGPCDPGSSVILEGIVWNESRNGLLVVNVTWRGKTYVGTLMDSTNHNWASPSFKEDSLSTDNNNSSSRDEDGGVGGVAMAPEGRRLRRCRTMQPSNGSGVMTSASASAASSSSASTTSTASSKTSTTRTKCRVQVGDNSAQTDPVNLQQTLNGIGNGDAGILCPELHCQRRFKHESALRNHRFRAHKATDSIATSSAATSAAASSSARSIVDDCVGSALTTTSAAAQSKGPSLLLHAKQRCFDGDEDVSSAANDAGGGGGRGIKKSEDGARLCITEEKDGDDGLEAEEEEEDCSSTLIRSASGMMENNKLDCFVLSSSSRCLQSTPIICSGSVQMLSCAKLASSTAAAEMENGTGDAATLDSSDCPVSDGTVPMRDGGECITVCADRQKMRNGAKKHCKGRADRVQKNSETVVSSSGVASQMLLGQPSTTGVGEEASAAGASAGALLSLHSSEDKHCVKRLKTNGGMPFSMLSVSLNRIPMENESSLTRKTVPATETRSDDRLQDAEKSGSSSCSAAVDSVRGLGLDVAKLCIVSGFGSGPAGREPSAGKTPSQSLFAMRDVMGRYPPEKTQVDNSKCHLVKSGNMHTEEIAKPQLESSCVVLPGKGQNGSDSQTSSDRALTPSKLVFQSSKTCHDKLLAPGIVRDGNQKQTGLHSSSSVTFAADSSKSLLNHMGKESAPVSHLSYVDKAKPELSTSSAKGIPTSAFSLRNSTGESIGSQAAKQKCPSFSNPDQVIITDRGCTTISSTAVSSGGSSGPTLYAKDMKMCDLNSFTSNIHKDFSDLKGALPSRSAAMPFAVPMGSRSIPNGNLTWTTSPFVSSMSSLQHTTTRSNASSDPPPPLTSRGSTYVTALTSSMSSSLAADCSFVPFCRAIQGAPATTSLPKQMNKFCAPPSPPLASCPLEANTASEVFVRRDDGSWTSASGGKSAQQQQQQHAMISNSSCPDRNLLVCSGDISLPLPLQPLLSSSSGSSLATDLHHGGGGGVIPYQQKKEKMLSALHSSAMKPPQSSSTSSSSRSLLTGHSVQAACPK